MTDNNESADISFLSELSITERSDLEFELSAFGVRHASHHRPIALVTSGGTAADLELNSVRCLDNFSTGLRGAISVEEFLKRGYAVIHLQRIGSASPYGRVLSQSLACPANFGVTTAGLGKLFAGDVEEDKDDQLVQSVLEEEEEQQQVDLWMTDASPQLSTTATNAAPFTAKRKKASDGLMLHRRLQHSSRLLAALNERSAVLKEGRLLTVPFRSVEEYLGKLQLCAEALQDSQSLAILYLAAAVSDFYIPKSKRSQHKIQSANKGNGGGGLTLELEPVPKMMGRVREKWAPDAFCCSFKLETDKDILRNKAERAVEKYDCHMVIGNLLQTRHEQVWILAPPEDRETTTPQNVTEWPLQEVTKPKSSDSDALEHLILDVVVQAHFEHISSSTSMNKAGTEAVVRAHQALEEKRAQVQREIFWKQVQTTALEWGGVVAGAVLSYVVSAALRRRMSP